MFLSSLLVKWRTTNLHHHHRRGSRWSRRSSCSPTKLLGQQVIHPASHFFCNSQLKVALRTVKGHFNAEILENAPAYFEKKTFCIKLYFEFACIVFSNFCFPEKSFSHLW